MLEIQLKHQPQTLVEVFQIAPDRLASLTLSQIQRLPVHVGNQTAEFGDWFIVSGDPSDQHLQWTGDLSGVGGIGHGMRRGWIQVDGSVGNHLGARMSGGTIQVSGSAGNFVGAEMTGGLIHVKGDAGNSVGAAYDGGQAGQNGGVIMIEGSASNRVGKSMRRGLIAVGGDVNNCCGHAMRAGTIIVFGSTQKNVGLEMIRGTIMLMEEPSSPPFGFADGGLHSMPVTRMLDRYLNDSGFSKSIPHSNFRIFHGDSLQGSRGELLINAK